MLLRDQEELLTPIPENLDMDTYKVVICARSSVQTVAKGKSSRNTDPDADADSDTSRLGMCAFLITSNSVFDGHLPLSTIKV